MATEDRQTSSAVGLEQQLTQEAYHFDFFQALRRLECVYRNKPRIGESRRPSDDPVRLALEPSMAFAPATFAKLTPGKDGRPPRLTQYFLGLLGPNAPLPLHLTEYGRQRLHNFHDPTFVRFLDIFHHRILSLFYRAWADAQPTANFDRPQTDRFALYIGALFGLGMPSLHDRDAVWDLAKYHYSGHLSCQNRHAEGLESILKDFFRLPVRVEPFVGRWLLLSAASQCRLGESRATGVLGETVVIGERLWDCQHSFRIVMGPLRFREYQRLLPGGDSLKRLVSWVRNYVGDELVWDVNLILHKDDVPPLKMEASLEGTGMACLGWTTWLTTGGLDRHADDLKLDALSYEH
ncbi:MAG: type VI secretion system baseplate subunit TssG [Gammaproteobacteria bacterium]|nr:type VI secretion system baseplate subunit TssG [Gammaproteobacteria bacterium]MCP5425485.1 type VI secretion system baseplate subunit TssG [Gammaproteobacteria bacterium]